MTPERIEELEEQLDAGESPELDVAWEKMSKSKYNGIDPAAVVSEFGADATRLAMLFKAPVVRPVFDDVHACDQD